MRKGGGSLPGGVSPERYLSGESATSNPPNVKIAQTLYRSGDIEAYGTGLQRIKSVCDEQGARGGDGRQQKPYLHPAQQRAVEQ